MINPLKFGTTLMNDQNYQELLSSSTEEFYTRGSVHIAEFLNRYKSASHHRKIHHCFLKNHTTLIASCILVETTVLIKGQSVSAYFVTQVVTVEKYRRSGCVRQLMKEIEDFGYQNRITLLIVVARRAVGDLYWKLGFSGFSYFPEFTLSQQGEISTSDFFRPAKEFDLNQLELSHLEYTSTLFGFVERTSDDWLDILRQQSATSHQILVPLNHEKDGYVITRNDVVVELVLNQGSNFESRFISELERSFKKIILDQFEPAAKFISAANWKYSERFEPKEGHLIKTIKNSPNNANDFIREITNAEGNFRLRLSLVDQW